MATAPKKARTSKPTDDTAALLAKAQGKLPPEPKVAATEGMDKVRELVAKRMGFKDSTTILRPISQNLSAKIERFSSGDLGLDIALGGGWPRGHAIKVQGKFSAGKSFILAQAIRIITKQLGYKVALVDIEGTWTDSWLKAQGIPTDLVYIVNAGTAEQALDIVTMLFASGEFFAVFLDSVAQLSPKDEFDGGMEEWQRGLLARLVNKFTRSMNSIAADFRARDQFPPTFFFTNQIRTNTQAKFNTDTTPGGTQQDNYASIILDVRHIGVDNDVVDGKTDDNAGTTVGRGVLATTLKNKTAPPLRKTIVRYLIEPYAGHPAYSFYHGDTALTMGIRLGIITKSGTWYAIGDNKLGQGAVNAIKTLVDTHQIPGICAQVAARLSESMKLAYTYLPMWDGVVPLSNGDVITYFDVLKTKGLLDKHGEAFKETDNAPTEVHPSQHGDISAEEEAGLNEAREADSP